MRKLKSRMTEEISARNITKFNGSNFQSWKFQVNALLLAHGIRDVVDGTRKMPDGAGEETAKKTWQKDNARGICF